MHLKNSKFAEMLTELGTDALINPKFLEKRKIFLWGAVTDESSEELVNKLLYLDMIDPGKEITFYINSPGGVVTSGMTVYDTIQMISSPVATVCIGMAASIGSIELVTKMLLYYFHERAWNKSSFGIIKKDPEYQI